ncbi:hypothetical protein [Cellulomonas marina]|uniref:Uncharacterized protein n=1 Tax=Cellulomonas marina TaxID=988821 RepID=A0A1I0XZ74_9CELL|nr:hypothetical protein [Cellulomonas marina]SFB05706.1 hypothetical protein SAMN05421867_10647 [Cellulomonas marina]
MSAAAAELALAAGALLDAASRVRGSVVAGQSLAAAALASRAGGTAIDLDRVADRAAAASRALGTYAADLEEAQARARTALEHARAAERVRDRAAAAADDVVAQQVREVDPVRVAALAADGAAAAGAMAAAEDDLAAARASVAAVEAARDASALAAARVLDANGPLPWSALGGLAASVGAVLGAVVHAVGTGVGTGVATAAGTAWDGVVAAGRWLLERLDTIAPVLSIGAFLLGWVPVLGQVLIVLATVAAVVALVRDLCRKLQGDDETTWWTVAGDLLGVVSGGLSRAIGVGVLAAAGGGVRFGTVVGREARASMTSLVLFRALRADLGDGVSRVRDAAAQVRRMPVGDALGTVGASVLGAARAPHQRLLRLFANADEWQALRGLASTVAGRPVLGAVPLDDVPRETAAAGTLAWTGMRAYDATSLVGEVGELRRELIGPGRRVARSAS